MLQLYQAFKIEEGERQALLERLQTSFSGGAAYREMKHFLDVHEVKYSDWVWYSH